LSVISVAMMSLVVVLLGAVLFYQVRLVSKISKLNETPASGASAKNKKSQDAVLTAVITAAISQYKIQNSQRQ